jgi:C-terminal processing protease CtpA/Prc
MKRLLLLLWACHAATPPKPIVLSENWCDRVVGGPSGSGTAAEASRAHAGIRFFGPAANYPAADQALAASLQNSTLPDLDLYAQMLGVCALTASPSPSPLPARVEMMGDVAIVHPGAGVVTLPAGTRAVAIDLRDLPASPTLDAALQAAIAPALGTPLPRSSLHVREHYGMNDEIYSPGFGPFKTSLVTNDRASLMPSGAEDLPLFLLVGPKLAPAAAEWAGELRLQGRAALVGASVFASIAEADWSPIGGRGLMWRARELRLDGQTWPDEIAADLRTDDPPGAIAQARNLNLALIDFGTPQRAAFDEFVLANQQQSKTLDVGVMRAALYVFHGAARLFFPYLAVTGDDIDARLDEVLQAVPDGVDRTRARDLIRRFANALHDGHFTFGLNAPSDVLPPPAVGYLPVNLDWFGARPVVHDSLEPLVHPGDTIIRYGGMAIEDWYASLAGTISAATDGAVKLRAGQRLSQLSGPTDLTLQDPSGAARDVTVQPQPLSLYQTLPLAPTRQNGFLGDLGRADLYYFNLDASVTNDPVKWNMNLADAHSAAGIILDMRGYPDTAYFTQLHALIGEWIGKPYLNPEYRVPDYQGLDDLTTQTLPQMMISAPVDSSLAYAGPLVWLVGPDTQSAAEDLSIAITSSGRIKKVVGRTSAGTDGNITGLVLPGQLYVTFTGMDVHFPDGREFDALGIVPDVIVPPSPADLAAGIDSDLAAAMQQL